MRYLLFVVLAAFTFGSGADNEVPFTFSDGTAARASEVNSNFDAIEAAILPNAADCFAGDIVKWNGQAWVCAEDPLADQDCKDGDRLAFSGTIGWSCQ